MNTPNNTLTKICSICGQRKPLSAFLQLAGLHGYGNICSSCRKTIPDAPKDEDSTRSTTGAKIDAKLKVKDALDKRESFKQAQEEYFKGREKQEEKRIHQAEKIGQVTEGEKKHRRFLEQRSSFLNIQKKPATPATPAASREEQRAKAGRTAINEGTDDLARAEEEVKKATSESVFGREKVEEKRIHQEKIRRVAENVKQHKIFQEKRFLLNTQNKSTAPGAPVSGVEEQKAKAGKIDVTKNTAEGSRPEGEAKKVQPSIYNALKDWLPGSRLLNATEQAIRQKRNETKAPGPPADSITDYVNKNTGPKSR